MFHARKRGISRLHHPYICLSVWLSVVIKSQLQKGIKLSLHIERVYLEQEIGSHAQGQIHKDRQFLRGFGDICTISDKFKDSVEI